jgi:hypothetical protein
MYIYTETAPVGGGDTIFSETKKKKRIQVEATMREISFLEQFLFSQGARIGCSRLQFPSGL